MGEGRLSPYTNERAFCTARRDESSAITGRIRRSAAASPICVYSEKLGLQSMNTMSYESAIASHSDVSASCCAGPEEVMDDAASVLLSADSSAHRRVLRSLPGNSEVLSRLEEQVKRRARTRSLRSDAARMVRGMLANPGRRCNNRLSPSIASTILTPDGRPLDETRQTR